jgi:hypothetical protein
MWCIPASAPVPRAPFAGAAPATPVVVCESRGPSLVALIVTGVVATGIVLWIREQAEEKRLADDHATMADQIEALEIELQAEEDNAELELEQERVRGHRFHGRMTR